MKSSAVYSASPSSLEIVVRRGSPYFFWISSISLGTMSQRLSSSLRSVVIWRARRRFSSSSLRMIEDLEPRQAVDLQLEDRVGLLGVEREALDDLLGRVRLAFGLADDLEDLVERVEDLLEAFEDVDALLERLELVLQAPGDDVEAEVEEVPEDLRADRAASAGRPRRSLGRLEAGEVHHEVGLQQRVLEQVGHHHLLVGVLLQLEHDPDVVCRHVLDVERAAAACGWRDLADLLDQRRLVDGVGDAGDVDHLRGRASRALPPTCRAAESRRSPVL